jgi:hypothetical protein
VLAAAAVNAVAAVALVSAGAWPFVIGCLCALAAFVIMMRALAGPNHRDCRRFVNLSDLDEQCSGLLLRAQQAIGTVLASRVSADSLLDQAAGEAVLRRHEWEIATALRDITRLRSEVNSSAVPGPLTAGVLDSHKHALKVAQDATESRIRALESYAKPVYAAETAQQDWRNAMKASGLNDKYLDLVARTAADQHAIAELTDLTEQAASAAEVFRDSLHQAALAAEALALPPAHQN